METDYVQARDLKDRRWRSIERRKRVKVFEGSGGGLADQAEGWQLKFVQDSYRKEKKRTGEPRLETKKAEKTGRPGRIAPGINSAGHSVRGWSSVKRGAKASIPGSGTFL